MDKTQVFMRSNNDHISKRITHVQLVSKVARTIGRALNLNDDLIDRYIASGSPLDKAGAYGYQDNAQFPIVKKINGSITNVIGFPVEEIKEDLKKFSL